MKKVPTCSQCGISDSSEGTVASFTIQAKDVFGNDKVDIATAASYAYTGDDLFSVSIVPNGFAAAVSDNLQPPTIYLGAGQYMVNYNLAQTTTADQVYNLTVFLQGQIIVMGTARAALPIRVFESQANPP